MLFTPHRGSAVVETRGTIERRAVDDVETVPSDDAPSDVVSRLRCVDG
jgi:hypothetical protein